MQIEPIGFFHSESQKHPYQAGRQPDGHGEPGVINLISGKNFEQALQDLEGCTHLWIIFGFHHNKNWKPLVQTPRSDSKIGVFATRAPYRPNPIGLSCVSLQSIDGLHITIGPSDLLDGSPIFDIKPYHPEVDSIPQAKIAWLESTQQDAVNKKYYVTMSPAAESQIDFLELQGVKEIRPFLLRQLEFDPINKDKKRVKENGALFTLSYRTYRIDFTVVENKVAILTVYSGYSSQELASEEDPYLDKDIHRKFVREFGS